MDMASKNKSANKSGSQSTAGFDQPKRWSLKELMELIEKGRSIADDDIKFQTEVDALNVVLKIGHRNEYLVRFLIFRISLS